MKKIAIVLRSCSEWWKKSFSEWKLNKSKEWISSSTSVVHSLDLHGAQRAVRRDRKSLGILIWNKISQRSAAGRENCFSKPPPVQNGAKKVGKDGVTTTDAIMNKNKNGKAKGGGWEKHRLETKKKKIQREQRKPKEKKKKGKTAGAQWVVKKIF